MKRFSTNRQTILTCAFAVFTALVCAGLLAAAVLVPAPLDVMPPIIVACIGMPMAAAFQAADHLQRRRRAPLAESSDREPLDMGALKRLRRQLAQIPEIPHPLDY